MTILQTENLSKHYGRIRAIDGLNLCIEQGQVYGILGPNGSGKTTLLGTILGVLRPSAGSFTWFEGRYGKNPRRRMGALLETPNFYPYLNAVENLRIVAHIKRAANPRIDDLLELVKLSERKHSKFKTYSLGMKQRLAIAATLIGDPEVLIYDEPTNGLDPLGIAEVRSTLQQIAAGGKTVLLASHILDEVEKICSHVAILQRGKLLAAGTVGSILSDEVEIEIGAPGVEKLIPLLEKHPAVKALERRNEHLLLKADPQLDPAELNRLAFQNGIVPHHLLARKKSLEKEFLEITGDRG